MFAVAIAAALVAQPVPGAPTGTPPPTAAEQALGEMERRLANVKRILFERELELLRNDIDALEKKIADAQPGQRDELDAAVVGLTYRLRDLHNKAGLTAPPPASNGFPRVGEK